jgi:hypothetical protein
VTALNFYRSCINNDFLIWKIVYSGCSLSVAPLLLVPYCMLAVWLISLVRICTVTQKLRGSCR